MFTIRRVAACLVLLLLVSVASGQSGSGDLRFGYVFLDRAGNESVYQPSFNLYQGVAVSLDNFRYLFKNGLQVNADLMNASLKNRNLRLGLTKPGLFGADFANNQYRRVYDFNGANFTRRNQTGVNLWGYPVKYVRLYSSGHFINNSGEITDLFQEDIINIPTRVDYDQMDYTFGARFNYRGRMLESSYKLVDYSDAINELNDQKRDQVRADALLPVPRFEWLILSGGFRWFRTEYDKRDLKLTSTTVRGGALLTPPERLGALHDFSLNYMFFFNRAGSDLDLVKTDNLSQAVYATYSRPRSFGLTAGYQVDVNDDFDKEINANSYYGAGWIYPAERLEVRGEVGFRAEEVDEGTRIFGDVDRSRYKFSGKYRVSAGTSFGFKLENRMRKFDRPDVGIPGDPPAPDTKVNFSQVTGIVDHKLFDRIDLAAGYTFSKGDYTDTQQKFKFSDHSLRFNAGLAEYRNFTLGAGVIFYKSQRDLDVETSNLWFSGGYKLRSGIRVEAKYNVYNFDNFLADDQYFTENIVELNLIKSMSF